MRYVVKKGSVSAHCCFEATVLDTQPNPLEEKIVCECFDMEDAKLICKLLNKLTNNKKEK